MGINGNGLTVGPSPKWSVKELQLFLLREWTEPSHWIVVACKKTKQKRKNQQVNVLGTQKASTNGKQHKPPCPRSRQGEKGTLRI